MFRPLLTGIFALALTSASFGMAQAAVTGTDLTAATGPVVAVETAAEGGTVSEAAIARAKAHLAALDSAAPTANADLAMWGVAPAVPAAQKRFAHLSPVRRFASGIIARSASIAANLTRSAMRFLGTPYVFGGTSTGGFDCSGYVQHVFAMLGFALPRTADAQYAAGHRIAGGMRTGDLVFFQTYEIGPSHVGIYLGNDHFVHASSSHGVTVSSLHDSYWAARYLGAKRVVD